MADIKGPGAITHVWTTFRGTGRDLIIRFYWEGSEHPSIEAPIGDFFGVAMAMDAPMASYPIQVSSEGRARNCWWYMPFNRSARVTVSATRSPENQKRKTVPLYYYIDYRVFDRPTEEIHYLHARFQETDPAQRGVPVKLLEVEGCGHFVGVVMGNRARTPGWFGEGDDIITVDGEVSFWGTGTEDYFCDAWGFRVFSDLYHGVPAMEGRDIGNRVSAYRFHILDPIPFRKSFKLEIEHWPWISPAANTGRDYYSSVGFWYQRGIHKPWPRLTEIVSNRPWDPSKGRWHVDGALEAESLPVTSYRSNKGTEARPAPKFEMPNLSGDHMILFDTGGDGELSLAVSAPEAGTYRVAVYYVRAPEYGIVKLRVNDSLAGEADTFQKTDDLTRPIWPPKKLVFDGVTLKAGSNRFVFSVDSKNPKAEGYQMGIDCLVLEKQKE
ncbi:MAG: DUF2961 domain-containing protein [Planctomycetes bacterium]|nr:DUF2961 domain-containing protein [Planctomycetota bacterium]